MYEIKPYITFLTIRVKITDNNGWVKMKILLNYLCVRVYLPLVLRDDDLTIFKWYFKSPYATHGDCIGHNGEISMIGKGIITSIQNNQKLNTRISTETHLISVRD